MIYSLIKFIFIFFIFEQTVLAQNNLERVRLHFTLAGFPTIQAVGFDSSKSYWKASYRFAIVDDQTLNKDIVPLEKIKVNTKIKKRGILIQKGDKVIRQLGVATNREIIFVITLNEKVKKLLSSGNAYSFLFRIKAKIYSPTLKKKIKIDSEFPARLQMEMQDARDLIEVKMGASITIEKDSDGKFGYSIFRN